MTFLRASIVIIWATASAKRTRGPNEKSSQKLRGPHAQEQHGGGKDRELFFGNGDGSGVFEGLFGDGGLEEMFGGGFGGGGTGGTGATGGTGGSGGGFAGGDADNLPEMIEDVVGGLADAFGITNGHGTGDSDGTDFDSVLTQIVDSFAKALDGLMDTLEAGTTEWNFTVLDWGDGAVWSSTETVSGTSVLGQVAGSFTCPQTCSDTALCDAIFAGAADSQALEQACDASCLPGPASCEDVCGAAATGAAARPWVPTAVARFIDLGAVTTMACDSCRFLACCGEDSAPDGGTPGAKFDTCQEYLPDANDLWTDVTNFDFETGDIQELVGSMDWVGLAEGLGLSDLFNGDLQSLLDEALAEYESFPMTCNQDSCPVDGLCGTDTLIDLVTFDLDTICAKDAFFGCGEGLKNMCNTECDADGNTGDSDDLKKTSFCALCSIATCCTTSEEQGKSFQDCALSALPEKLVTLLDTPSSSDASMIGGTPAEEEEAPGADTLSETSDGSGSLGGGTPAVAEDVLVESTDPSPAVEESEPSGSSKDTEPASEVSQVEEEPVAVNGDGSRIVLAAASEASSEFDFEVSHAKVQDSASYVLGTSVMMCLALL